MRPCVPPLLLLLDHCHHSQSSYVAPLLHCPSMHISFSTLPALTVPPEQLCDPLADSWQASWTA